MKIHPIVATALLIVIIVLAFALFRGCENEKSSSADNLKLKERLKKLEEDSTNSIHEKEVYQEAIQVQEGQLDISTNKIVSLSTDLDKWKEKAVALLKNHVPIGAAVDTTATLVPNEYLDECQSCFNELEIGKNLISKFRAEKDNQEQQYKSLLGTKDNRIKSLELSNSRTESLYRALLSDAKESQKRLEQRRTLYFKLGALAINQTFPNSAGAGLIYQDKMKRMFGVGVYLSPFGSIYSADIAFPLSLKRK